MQKITVDDPETRSADLVAENIDQLKALFPEVFIEDKVDFQVLKQLLGSAVDEREEKYGLNWHGKRQARQLALTPSTGTLRPCPGDSVDWETTQNLMIEGDNLEVLKLLQKSYAGKVKLIYIDPPYNTGNDFVYKDDYHDNIQNYLGVTGQIDGENRKMSSNTEASGRFHTDWLNMIYPRLRLAKSLLSRDGFIFISIDNNEVQHLKSICSEIFGEENFRNMIVVRRGVKNVQSQFDNISNLSSGHEYILCFSKDTSARLPKLSHESNADQAGKWDTFWRGTDRPTMRYTVFGQTPTTGQWRWSKDRTEAAKNNYEKFLELEEGPLALDEFFLEHKQSTNVNLDFVRLNNEGVVQYYVPPRDYKLISDNWMDVAIKGNVIGFDTEKHVDLMGRIIGWISAENDIVLDFFAGSGTTGHAVYLLNLKKGTSRRYILVQLEETARGNDGPHLAALTQRRLKKVIDELKSNLDGQELDLGFRVFKLDTSNIRAWDPNREDLDGTLLESIEHIKPDRSEEDVLYELLLKLGLNLCVPVESRTIAGKAVRSIGAGTLITCLNEMIDRDEVELLASGISDWHAELAPTGDSTVVFRDSAFVDDVAKTNLAAILEQRGLGTVRSL